MFKKRKLWMYTTLAIAFLLVVAFGFVGTAHALEIIDDDTIPAGTVIDDDVLIAGNNVLIDGIVNGNLFVAGNSVTLNGMVRGSFFAVGQNIAINGNVSGSTYAAANTMTLSSNAVVSRNLIFAGFGLETKLRSSVYKDVFVAGYQSILSGTVGRDLRAAVGALEIYGTISGDVKANVDSPSEDIPIFPTIGFPGMISLVPPGLRVDQDARINGELEYTSPIEQSDSIRSEPLGGIVYKTPAPGTTTPDTDRISVAARFGAWLLGRLRDFITLLLLGGVALWLIPTIYQETVDKALAEPLPSAGWGFLMTILGYIAAAVLAGVILGLVIFFSIITLGGLARSLSTIGFTSLGLAFALFILLVHFGSKLVLALLGGEWIVSKLAPNQTVNKFLPLVVGVFLYVILRGIPILGWMIGVAVTIIGIGAMWLLLQEKRSVDGKSRRPKAKAGTS